MYPLDPIKTTTSIWYNERTQRWNWVLIWESKEGMTNINSGIAFSKEQAKNDIMRLKIQLFEGVDKPNNLS